MPTRAELEAAADKSARKYGVEPKLLRAQINAESGWNPNAGSSAGAQGIAQIMPGTARAWGVNPNDPFAAIDAMALHMGQYLKKYKDVPKALAAYNAGEGAVAKYNGVPPFPETQNYVKKIIKNAGGEKSGGILSDVSNAVTDVVNAPVDGVKAVGDAIGSTIAPIGHFFANLVQPAFWLRVGKVILGMFLLLFALRRLA